ncbi:MAG TPA: hypothetical protein VE420_02775 [Gemmatimonadales bacterium]|nr:hypothetical protein [Gemmatimonadales bacterium]
MPGTARQFEPQITRSGGAPSQYRFTARCSQCRKADTYEAGKTTSDEVVKGYFKDRGWLLGRDRSDDLCSACLAHPRTPEPSRRVAEAHRVGPVAAGRQPDRSAPVDKRSRDTADILARHLGKPQALAAEVFRPREVQPSRPSAPEAARQPVPAPALPPEIQQSLLGMTADLKGLRSAMELMAEQVSKLVALGGQQIDAVARLAPLITQSAEGITDGLREVVSVVGSIPGSLPLPHPAEPLAAEEQPMLQREMIDDHDQAIGSEPEPHIQGKAEERLQQRRRSKRSEAKAHKTANASIVVKSIPDAKRSDRFYTTIRLPRDMWDRAGFGPDDRLVLDWSGKTLRIERAAEGGVKPKSIGDAAVVLQSWQLGYLNFDQPKVTSANASLRLTAKLSVS